MLTESVFASLQALPRSEFSDAQRERMDLFEIQILRKRGKFTEALARLEAHPPWSPQLEIRALRQQALILSGLKRYSAIEALLAPVCERLRQEPMRALDLVALLRFRTLAAAKLQQHAQVAALLQEATERITKRLGPEHLLSLDLRAHSAVVYATIGQYPLAIEILTELLPVFAAKLKPDHSILSSAQINLVLIIAEYTGSTAAQLVLARRLAATLMTDPEAGVRARMHMALIQMYVIEGKLDEARAAVGAYLAKPPPELAGPARIAQLEGWALVLDEAASPSPTADRRNCKHASRSTICNYAIACSRRMKPPCSVPITKAVQRCRAEYHTAFGQGSSGTRMIAATIFRPNTASLPIFR